MTSTKKLFSKEDAPKNLRSDWSQKIIFIATKAQNIFNTTRTRRIFPQRQGSKKNNSLIDQRYKIFKGTSAKKHFQMDNCQKSFSKRKDRQAPQNHFQSDRHQIRFQNEKCQKIFSKTQTEKTFLE